MEKLLATGFLMLSLGAFAGHIDTHDLKVEQISVWGDSGDLLVQTSPKHNIEGLSCSSDYWLKLNKNDEGYEALSSMLIAAQMAGKTITVRAVDDAGTDFCRLQRVIVYK